MEQPSFCTIFPWLLWEECGRYCHVLPEQLVSAPETHAMSLQNLFSAKRTGGCQLDNNLYIAGSTRVCRLFHGHGLCVFLGYPWCLYLLNHPKNMNFAPGKPAVWNQSFLDMCMLRTYATCVYSTCRAVMQHDAMRYGTHSTGGFSPTKSCAS